MREISLSKFHYLVSRDEPTDQTELTRGRCSQVLALEAALLVSAWRFFDLDFDIFLQLTNVKPKRLSLTTASGKIDCLFRIRMTRKRASTLAEEKEQYDIRY